MGDLTNFLLRFRNDVFKLLPMKEDELNGKNNHLFEYLDSLVVNAKGSTITYPELSMQKKFLYVINDLSFLLSNEASFEKWRKIILDSTGSINKLYLIYEGKENGNNTMGSL